MLSFARVKRIEAATRAMKSHRFIVKLLLKTQSKYALAETVPFYMGAQVNASSRKLKFPVVLYPLSNSGHGRCFEGLHWPTFDRPGEERFAFFCYFLLLSLEIQYKIP